MVKWKIIADKDEWNQYVFRSDKASPFQMYEWGASKESQGVLVRRLLYYDEDNKLYCPVQMMIRKKYFLHIIWVPGGPAGDLTLLARQTIVRSLQEIGIRHFVLRISSLWKKTENDENILRKLGWTKALHSINSGKSMMLQVNQDPEINKKNMSSNWRHNLKRAEKNQLRIEKWSNPEPEELYKLYIDLEQRKNIGQQFSREEIKYIISNFKHSLHIIKAFDKAGEICGFRGIILTPFVAWDTFAVTTEEGRKCYASHAILGAMLAFLRKNDIENYDLSGVDPIGNPGVYNFKKGTGALEICYMGEWDVSSSFLWTKALNILLKFRKGL